MRFTFFRRRPVFFFALLLYFFHALRINCSCASMVRPSQRAPCTIRHYIIKISWLVHIQRRRIIVRSSHPCARRIRGRDAAFRRRKLLCYLVRRTHFFSSTSLQFFPFFSLQFINSRRLCAPCVVCMQMHTLRRERISGAAAPTGERVSGALWWEWWWSARRESR